MFNHIDVIPFMLGDFIGDCYVLERDDLLKILRNVVDPCTYTMYSFENYTQSIEFRTTYY